MKKIFLSVLTLMIILGLSFGDLSNASASNSNQNLDKPESNVNEKTKENYIEFIKKSDRYKKYANETDIDKVKKDNIIVENNQTEDGKKNVYTVSFIFGEKLAKANNNLATVNFKYAKEKDSIFFDSSLYAKYVNHDNEKYVNLTSHINDQKYYEFNIKDGKLYNSNFEEVDKQEIKDTSATNLGVQKEGWCEWAVGALCGGGGAAGCYGAAAALGITTGIGGLSLATVCGIISSLGCTAATKKICG